VESGGNIIVFDAEDQAEARGLRQHEAAAALSSATGKKIHGDHAAVQSLAFADDEKMLDVKGWTTACGSAR